MANVLVTGSFTSPHVDNGHATNVEFGFVAGGITLVV